MQGRKLRIGRVVGAVVVVGFIVGGSWWAISENGGEEESVKPAVVEQVLPVSGPALAELEGLSKEIEGVSEEVSSLKEDVKDIKKKFSPAPVEPVLPSVEPALPSEKEVLTPEAEEADAAAALGESLHGFADFCTLLFPEMEKTMEDMLSSFQELTLASVEATAPEEVAPPQEEKKGFLSRLLPFGQGEGAPQPGGGFISWICGRLPCYALLAPYLQFM
jgi:hypothetical protein